MATALAAGLAAHAALRQDAQPIPRKATAADEVSPVARGPYFAWMQRNGDSQGRYAIYVQRRGSPAVRLATGDARVALGSLDGRELLYLSNVTTGGSTVQYLVRYDVVSRARRMEPVSSLSRALIERLVGAGGRLLVADYVPAEGGPRLALYDLRARTTRVLDTLPALRESWFVPGAVSTRYAVWTRCNPEPACSVVRLDLRSGRRTTLPAPAGKAQYAPSLRADNGTVYLVRSDDGCGQRVQLLRVPTRGSWRVIANLPPGFDVTSTWTDVRDGGASVFYALVACTAPGGGVGPGDIYEIADR